MLYYSSRGAAASWALLSEQTATVAPSPAFKIEAGWRRGTVWFSRGTADSSPTTISCGVGTATATGYAANVAGYTVISCGTGTATASGYAVNIPVYTAISCGVGTALAIGFRATITTADDEVAPTRPIGGGNGRRRMSSEADEYDERLLITRRNNMTLSLMAAIVASGALD